MSKAEIVIYGLHAVQARLARGGVRAVWVLKGRHDNRMQSLLDEALTAGVEVRRVAREILDEHSGSGRHQGVVAWADSLEPASEADLWQSLEAISGPPFLLVLDGVQDPHNLGACLRTADAAGVQGVIAPKDRAATLTPTVRKVACGAAEAVPFFQVTNLARTLRGLRERGVWLIGTAGEGDTELFDADLRGPLALVMGAEGTGLRRLTREHCDVLVRLPMRGSVGSLNVSVATGVALYEALRQRSR